MRAIPKDNASLMRFFGEDVEKGIIESPYDIRDVWKENFSTNSAQKVWAAKFAARHPNVAVLDLSSFKCGHDAPTYAIIDKILGASRTPHLTLHDIDANKPGGSIKIRVKTFAYTLEQYKTQLAENR
jgi:predicted nucleotide-binding protein (sugar kinase/HSP70/actin superfamily)